MLIDRLTLAEHLPTRSPDLNHWGFTRHRAYVTPVTILTSSMISEYPTENNTDESRRLRFEDRAPESFRHLVYRNISRLGRKACQNSLIF